MSTSWPKVKWIRLTVAAASTPPAIPPANNETIGGVLASYISLKACHIICAISIVTYIVVGLCRHLYWEQCLWIKNKSLFNDRDRDDVWLDLVCRSGASDLPRANPAGAFCWSFLLLSAHSSSSFIVEQLLLCTLCRSIIKALKGLLYDDEVTNNIQKAKVIEAWFCCKKLAMEVAVTNVGHADEHMGKTK